MPDLKSLDVAESGVGLPKVKSMTDLWVFVLANRFFKNVVPLGDVMRDPWGLLDFRLKADSTACARGKEPVKVSEAGGSTGRMVGIVSHFINGGSVNFSFCSSEASGTRGRVSREYALEGIRVISDDEPSEMACLYESTGISRCNG